VSGLEVALSCGVVLATVAAFKLWRMFDDEREALRKACHELVDLKSELNRHESNEAFRDLIRQRDKYQRQAIDMQLAANGLLAEREELFRELRRRAN
jgi:hypothetical protein